LAPDEDPDVIFGNLGPDPFWPDFTAAYLFERARGRSQAVKNFLMDNRVVTGIGNIYASEILFAGGIDPANPAQALTMQHWQKIVEQSRTILSEAIACGGSTIANYLNSHGEKGLFQTRLRVYGRADAPCPDCRQPIRRIRLGGRASYFCPHCQPPLAVAQKTKKKP
jgi:formamidopyrimidine-DNA glycosylase